MKIFLTGANGFIGSGLVSELIHAGHQVLGLTRSEAGAEQLSAAGAEVCRGDLEDSDNLYAGATMCDGVIHTAFDHDFSKYAANCQQDQRVIETLGRALNGSNRPFILTSTTLFGEETPGQLADEDIFNAKHSNPRVLSEIAAESLVTQGVNVSLVRLSQIHNTHRQGLVTFLIDLARRTGRSAYIEGCEGCWSAAHVTDTVRLFRLALERQIAGSRYHVTAEEGVSVRSIAEAIGQRLDLPVEALSQEQAMVHFGWLYGFVSKNMIASAQKTKERLKWQPVGAGLLQDIANTESGTL